MHIPVLHQRVSVKILRPLPIQIRNVLGRADVLARVAMAVQAEGHAQRLQLPDLIEFVHLPMAMHATDPAIYVDRVIEVDEVRHFVNLHPRNRSVVREAQAHRQQSWIVRQHLAVTIHAHARTGNVRIPGPLHVVVAIAAINPKLLRMNRMRKIHRLRRLIPDIRIFRREIVRHSNARGRPEKHRAEDHPAGQLVRPFWKNI